MTKPTAQATPRTPLIIPSACNPSRRHPSASSRPSSPVAEPPRPPHRVREVRTDWVPVALRDTRGSPRKPRECQAPRARRLARCRPGSRPQGTFGRVAQRLAMRRHDRLPARPPESSTPRPPASSAEGPCIRERNRCLPADLNDHGCVPLVSDQHRRHWAHRPTRRQERDRDSSAPQASGESVHPRSMQKPPRPLHRAGSRRLRVSLLGAAYWRLTEPSEGEEPSRVWVGSSRTWLCRPCQQLQPVSSAQPLQQYFLPLRRSARFLATRPCRTVRSVPRPWLCLHIRLVSWLHQACPAEL